MNGNKRIYYIDAINIFSTFSVVALHCEFFDEKWQNTIVEVLFYCAVPLFFMLSGANLVGYRKRYDTRTFFRKRVRKTVIPYLAMTFILSLAFLFINRNDVDIARTVQQLVVGFLVGSAPYATYWFFIPLFLLYAFMPFISVMVGNLTRRQQLSLIALLFVLQSCFLAVFGYCSDAVHSTVIGLHGLPMGNYLIYILLGYYLSNSSWEKRDRLLVLLGAAGLALMALRFVMIYKSENPMVGPAYNYLAAYAVLPSTAIFLIFKRICSGRSEHPIVTFLARRSFGVFLIQAAVINIFISLLGQGTAVSLCLIPVAYLVCVGIVYIVQQLKVLRWLMP